MELFTKAIVFKRFGGHCVYCREKLVSAQMAHDGSGIRIVHRHAYHRVDGREVMSRLASVDHLLEKSLGGSNARSNLVLSCLHCNGIKARYRSKPKWSFRPNQHYSHYRISRGDPCFPLRSSRRGILVFPDALLAKPPSQWVLADGEAPVESDFWLDSVGRFG